MSKSESKGQHILELARDLLDDLELSRLSAEALLLKATRLARLAGTPEDQEWLGLELVGYNYETTVAQKYMNLTGRWVDQKEGKAYWGPLAQHDATLDALKLQMSTLTTQGMGGEGVATAVSRIARDSNSSIHAITTIAGVRSRVLGLLHQFASRVYYELLFGQIAQTIFEQYQTSVDTLLAPLTGDALNRLPSAYERLAAGDQEAVSHALTTCRRVIDAFADAVLPPGGEVAHIDGGELKLGPEHHKNRINFFVSTRVVSSGRRDRIRKSLNGIYERVSAGVHSDVMLDEARALVLATYVLLGEIAQLPAPTA